MRYKTHTLIIQFVSNISFKLVNFIIFYSFNFFRKIIYKILTKNLFKMKGLFSVKNTLIHGKANLYYLYWINLLHDFSIGK